MLNTSPDFTTITGQANLIPIIRELPADLETPVSIYLKLSGHGPSFLLESVTGGEQLARYSFIGVMPRRTYVFKEGQMQVAENGKTRFQLLDASQDPLTLLRAEMAQFRPVVAPELPPLIGGLVGYLGYEVVSCFEPTVPVHDEVSVKLPEAIFLFADTLIAFDHAYGKVVLIANAYLNGDREAALEDAETRLDTLEAAILGPLPELPGLAVGSSESPELHSNTTREEFMAAVQQAKEHIAAGDIFQVVLSQRFTRQTKAHPFSIYRALRRLNPSPYMFYFDFGTLASEEPVFLIGASPEMHVRFDQGRAFLRPIAGTRPRGQSVDEDDKFERELISDPKERAEHVMLVDLARNDLGRVCEYGTVEAPELMTVERYSHVMHIVSQVEGTVQEDKDAYDLLRVTFPAGTVSGAPKIRAMQIITDLEQESRGPYAGAVGYFSFDGSMDTCITIRTLLMQGKTISVQSGAGIVADSIPEREYEETLSKARALAAAVELAEKEGKESS